MSKVYTGLCVYRSIVYDVCMCVFGACVSKVYPHVCLRCTGMCVSSNDVWYICVSKVYLHGVCVEYVCVYGI